MTQRHPRWSARAAGRLTGLLCLLLLLPATALAETWQLEDVNVIDVETGAVLTGQDLRITAGRIESMGPSGSLDERRRRSDPPLDRVDGQGGWLIPALAEMHAHIPPASQGERATQDVLTLFLARGVTTLRGMLGEPSHLELRDRLASGTITGPRLITSGPSFNGSTVSSPEQAAERVRAQAAAGYDFIKIHPGLSRAEFIATAETAKTLGLPIAGHVSFATGLQTALDYGQDSIDHLDAYAEAMVPEDHALHGEAPQFFGLNLADGMDSGCADALAKATAAAKVWQVPTQSLFETTTGSLTLDELQARPGMDMLGETLLGNWRGAVENIRASATPAQREKFLAARRALLLAMQREGVGLLLGSDAPQIMNVPGYATHQELEYYVAAGLSPLQALQTGTVNVARYLGEPDRGTIAAGKMADFILLEASPLDDITNTTRILGVSHDGRWHDRATLERMLDGVRDRKL